MDTPAEQPILAVSLTSPVISLRVGAPWPTEAQAQAAREAATGEARGARADNAPLEATRGKVADAVHLSPVRPPACRCSLSISCHAVAGGRGARGTHAGALAGRPGAVVRAARALTLSPHSRHLDRLAASKDAWSKHRRERQHGNAKQQHAEATQPQLAEAAPGCTKQRAVTLRDLLAAGVVQAGPGCLHLTHKGQVRCAPHTASWSERRPSLSSQHHTASLQPDGTLLACGAKHASLTSWSTAVKKQADATRKTADNGWKSVRYGGMGGPTLDELKTQLTVRAYAASAMARDAAPDARAIASTGRSSTRDDGALGRRRRRAGAHRGAGKRSGRGRGGHAVVIECMRPAGVIRQK